MYLSHRFMDSFRRISNEKLYLRNYKRKKIFNRNYLPHSIIDLLFHIICRPLQISYGHNLHVYHKIYLAAINLNNS